MSSQPTSILCPVCRANNPSGPHCRRCKADLSLLFRLESQRAAALDAARRALADQDAATAQRLAQRARCLRDDVDARQVAALAALLAGDFAAALRYASSC